MEIYFIEAGFNYDYSDEQHIRESRSEAEAKATELSDDLEARYDYVIVRGPLSTSAHFGINGSPIIAMWIKGVRQAEVNLHRMG